MTYSAAELIKLNNLPLAGRLVSDELGLGIHNSRRARDLCLLKKQFLLYSYKKAPNVFGTSELFI
jgi:hypothetical protein